MDLVNLGNTCVIGLFWGDEGKGKIVDLLSEHADVVVRYNGGANAGHTVVIDQQRFALHLVPCGTLHPGKCGVIGPGVALDPQILVQELDMLQQRGIAVDQRMRISTRCHLVMPYHKLEDQLNEQGPNEDDRIGTTARGIGPCYADKMQRSTALRFCDLLEPELFGDRLRRICRRKQIIFQALHGYADTIDPDEIAHRYLQWVPRLTPLACDTTAFLQDRLDAGERLLFEGAHGTLLDIDHGTYPYVTSSSSSALGVASGAGVPAATVHTLVGVVKAYTTRVGQGPFPTELSDDRGTYIREQGGEYGTTTGRPRRCGWFDAVAGRYAVQIGGIQHVAVMHLDTLSGLDPLQICTAYDIDGRRSTTFPAEIGVLQSVTPVYETFPGWSEDISGARSFAELPTASRRYLARIEELIKARVSIVSVGPDRRQTIIRNEP